MEDESELLARSAEIGAETVVGAGTSVGESSKIVGSVIGRRCKIGRNVKIVNSILCDDVVVEDNSVVLRSMLCDHVKIGADSELPSGCVVSFGVDVPIGSHLKENVRLTSMAMLKMSDGFSDSDIDESNEEEESHNNDDDDDDDDDDEKTVYDTKDESEDKLPHIKYARKPSNLKAGYAGCGREWTFEEFCNQNDDQVSSSSSSDSSNENNEDRRKRMKEKRLLLKQQASGFAGDEMHGVKRAFSYAHSFDVESNDFTSLKHLHSLGYVSNNVLASRRSSKNLGSLSSLTLGPRSVSNDVDENDEEDMLEQDRKFASEIYGMITRPDANINDVAVEIKSFTLAEDRFHTDSVMAAVPAILDLVNRENVSSSKHFLNNMNEMLKTWSKLLLRFRYSEQEEIIEQSILNAIEEYVSLSLSLSLSLFEIVCQQQQF
jgi:carbonic anhydrase/acetyltransferase-like protein (isoleucine patch superfamily)